MCAYDWEKASDSNKCHFTVYDSNTCYLGTLMAGETNLLSTVPVTTAHLYLKDGKYNIL